MIFRVLSLLFFLVLFLYYIFHKFRDLGFFLFVHLSTFEHSNKKPGLFLFFLFLLFDFRFRHLLSDYFSAPIKQLFVTVHLESFSQRFLISLT